MDQSENILSGKAKEGGGGGGGGLRTVTFHEQETLPFLLPFRVLLDDKLHIYLSCRVQNVQSYVFTIHVNMMSVCRFCGETHVVFQQRKVSLTQFNNYITFLGRLVEDGAGLPPRRYD